MMTFTVYLCIKQSIISIVLDCRQRQMVDAIGVNCEYNVFAKDLKKDDTRSMQMEYGLPCRCILNIDAESIHFTFQ